MNEIAHALIAGFAAWRVASLVAFEMGPGDVLERLRRLLGVPEDGEIVGVVPKLATCIWCSTVTLAPLMWLLGALVAWWIPGVLAAAAVAVTLEGINGGGHR